MRKGKINVVLTEEDFKLSDGKVAEKYGFSKIVANRLKREQLNQIGSSQPSQPSQVQSSQPSQKPASMQPLSKVESSQELTSQNPVVLPGILDPDPFWLGLNNEFGDKKIRLKILENVEDDNIKDVLLRSDFDLSFIADKRFDLFNERFNRIFNKIDNKGKIIKGCYAEFVYVKEIITK
jgi:hypothetical protein